MPSLHWVQNDVRLVRWNRTPNPALHLTQPQVSFSWVHVLSATPAGELLRSGFKHMDNTEKIKVAFRLLLSGSSQEKPWVRIEHSSGKFVQFAGSLAEPLLLDLPWQPMSEAEFYRAVAYFKKLGVVGEEMKMFDHGGRPVVPQFTFGMTFHCVDAATKTVLDIFDEVYSLPRDSKLAIATSWDDSI
jgi:hypothetical protein